MVFIQFRILKNAIPKQSRTRAFHISAPWPEGLNQFAIGFAVDFRPFFDETMDGVADLYNTTILISRQPRNETPQHGEASD